VKRLLNHERMLLGRVRLENEQNRGSQKSSQGHSLSLILTYIHTYTYICTMNLTLA
jgi:hypothetical protein